MVLTLITWALLITLGILAYLSLRHPGYAFALVTATYAVEHILLQGRSGLPIRPAHANIGMGLVCLAAIAFAYQKGKLRNFQLKSNDLWGFALISLAGLSLIWSPDIEVGYGRLKSAFPYFMLFAVFAPLCLYPSQQIKRFMGGIVLIGGITCLGLSISEMYGRSVRIETLEGQSVSLNPLASGAFGAYTAICSLFFIYSRSLSRIAKVGMYVTVALGIYVIAQSGSRGQFVAFVISTLIWLPIAAGVVAKRSTVIAIIMAAVASISAFILFEHLGFSQRIQSDSVVNSVGGRLEMATTLVSVAWSKGVFHVLFGLGNSAAFHYVGYYPHIVPLEILAEEGVLGGLLFVAFVATVFGRARMALLLPTLGAESRLGICLMACLFTVEVILCLKQGSLLGSMPMFSFGMALVYSLKGMFLPVPEVSTAPLRRYGSAAVRRS